MTTHTATALPIAFIDACIECNRRGIKEFEATGHPGYSFRASDRAALECLRWIEAAFPDASEERIAHSAYCFAQGARGNAPAPRSDRVIVALPGYGTLPMAPAWLRRLASRKARTP